MQLKRVFIFHLTTVSCLFAQLHLITGTSTWNRTDNYPVGVLQVSESGKVTPVAEVISAKEGLEWLALSYQEGLAVFIPHGTNQLRVVSFNTATVVKQCEIPANIRGPDGMQWLADVPGSGIVLSWENAKNRVDGMILNPAIPCKYSFVVSTFDQIQYITAHGATGIGDHVLRDGLSSGLDEDGYFYKGQRIGPKVPVSLTAGGFAGLIINNPQVWVIGVVKDAVSEPKLLVYRKRDSSWQVLAMRARRYAILQNFGPYITGVETLPKKAVDAFSRRRPGEAAVTTESRETEVSPGRKEWRTKIGKYGPETDESFLDALVLFPGRLHIYNIESQKHFTIHTNQADSEILLIDRSTVYYRISDRLYSAEIKEEGLGEAKLLASDESIRDAHWAFMKQ